jgi:hypothetical protein
MIILFVIAGILIVTLLCALLYTALFERPSKGERNK